MSKAIAKVGIKESRAPLLCLVGFIVHLVALRTYAIATVGNGTANDKRVSFLFWISILWLSFAALFWYKSTKRTLTTMTKLAVLLLTPVIFSPILGILYIFVVLAPLYGGAGR